jgi:DNA-binding transcriptional LysR family regulator
MTFDQLRVFVAVAERQHVTRAAEALNMGQSAVSAAIAALEIRHGTKLFHRVGRGIELTSAGELFLTAARSIIAQVEAAELLLDDLNGGKRGTLLVQASQTISSYWLPRHLVTFRRLLPSVDIRLTVGNTAQVAKAVQCGEAELGFVEGCVEDTALFSAPVARDNMILVVSPGHPWANRDMLSPAELVESEWVLREPGSGTRSEFEHALAGFGLALPDLRVALELPSNEAVRGAVEAGLGATAISASVAGPSLEAGLLRQVRLPLPERSFYALRHAERFQSHAAETFMAVVRGEV